MANVKFGNGLYGDSDLTCKDLFKVFCGKVVIFSKDDKKLFDDHIGFSDPETNRWIFGDKVLCSPIFCINGGADDTLYIHLNSLAADVEKVRH